MSGNLLPLYNLYRTLQDNDFQLGIDEYLTLIRALEGGFGLGNVDDLLSLCCLMWAKNPNEIAELKYIFHREIQPYLLKTINEQIKSAELQVPSKPSTTISNPNHQINIPASSSDQFKPNTYPVTHANPTLVSYISETQHKTRLRASNVARSKLQLEYFPVTKRQMRQSWRYLRRRMQKGPAINLDLEATIDYIGRNGGVLTPVFVPLRVNLAEIIFFIDRDGSMVPFHGLCQQILGTAERGGRLKQVSKFYFHDWPDEDLLFRDQARIEAVSIKALISNKLADTRITPHTYVVIMSDAGAARGTFDKQRIEETKLFLTNLKKYIRHITWLNPMPQSRWQFTSAHDISRFVPMFEMSRSGLNAAIDTLRGRVAKGR